MKKIWLTILLPVLFSIPSQAGIRACLEFFKEKPEVSQAIRWNLFTTSRSLHDYIYRLHKDFSKSLSSLKAADTWIDLGAGKGLAGEDYLKGRPYVQFAANVVLVAYKIDRFFRLPKFNGKLQVLEGRMWEEISTSEIPKAKLMTDYFGVISYTKDMQTALTKIFDRLEKDGELYIYSTQYLTVFEKDGKNIHLESFLKEVTGLQVEGRHGVLKVVKVAEEIKIPQLELIQIVESEKPFFRRFRVSSN